MVDTLSVSISENHITRKCCCWKACFVILCGALLIVLGIVSSVLGYIEDSSTQNEKKSTFGPGQAGEKRLHLNNYSFFGPVLMGSGGFLIVVAVVMIFENKENATKLGSPIFTQNKELHQKSLVNFESSSSQTTFLDRNIVHTLKFSTGTKDGISETPPNKPFFLGSFSHASGSCSTKRASLSGMMEMTIAEPGLALMDDFGRMALTSAFIHFQQDTNSKLSNFFHSHDSTCLPKCPSAPNIQGFPGFKNQNKSLESNGGFNYRLLTPTMYRSRIKVTRQTVSMDSEETNKYKSNLRVPSPNFFLRQNTQYESFELELGASAAQNHSFDSTHSLLIDVHTETKAPLTLLIKEEKNSNFTFKTKSSFGEKLVSKLIFIDDDENENEQNDEYEEKLNEAERKRKQSESEEKSCKRKNQPVWLASPDEFPESKLDFEIPLFSKNPRNTLLRQNKIVEDMM